jgi:hypothetical protein
VLDRFRLPFAENWTHTQQVPDLKHAGKAASLSTAQRLSPWASAAIVRETLGETMADAPKEQQSQISIQIDAQQATGVYSNLMMISHRKEEFILDFLFVQPQRAPDGQAIANLRSRVITTPEHMKRILKAIEENIGRYERSFGSILEATDMPKVMH